MSAPDPKRTFLLRAIRKRSLPVIGSRGYLLPALRTATPPCCAVGGPTPQRHRRVRGRTRTKSKSRIALQVLGCVTDGTFSIQKCDILFEPDVVLGEARSHEAAGIHHTSRWRCWLAACGSRAADASLSNRCLACGQCGY